MGCAMDPSTSAPAIAQAQKAGIVVGVYGGTPDMDQRAETTYNTDDPYALDAKLATEQAIEQHNGQPFNAIAITSTATGPATVIEEDAIKAELAKDCPKCTLTAVNVEVPAVADADRQHRDLPAAAAPRRRASCSPTTRVS